MAIQRLAMVLSVLVVEAILLIGIAAGSAGTNVDLGRGPQSGSPIPTPSELVR